MILGIEIGLAVLGILLLSLGKFRLSPTRVVRGWPARLLGVVALLPFPVAFVLGFVTVILMGRPIKPDEQLWFGLLIDGGCVVGCVLALFGLGWLLSEPVTRAEEDDEDDEDDVPVVGPAGVLRRPAGRR